MSSFTTIEKLKEYLRIQGNKDDAVLSRLITANSLFIESWLNRKLDVATYKDRFSGTGLGFHSFHNYPVISVTSVKIDNIPETNYDFDADQLFLNDGYFNRGRNNCVIEYTAGYQTIPYDIEQACIELCAVDYRQSETVNLASKSLGGETTSFIVKDMPDFVKVVLKQYKNVVPV